MGRKGPRRRLLEFDRPRPFPCFSGWKLFSRLLPHTPFPFNQQVRARTARTCGGILLILDALSHVTARCYEAFCATRHDRLHTCRNIDDHVCFLSCHCTVLSRMLQHSPILQGCSSARPAQERIPYPHQLLGDEGSRFDAVDEVGFRERQEVHPVHALRVEVASGADHIPAF